jgi:hypothetical protein
MYSSPFLESRFSRRIVSGRSTYADCTGEDAWFGNSSLVHVLAKTISESPGD